MENSRARGMWWEKWEKASLGRVKEMNIEEAGRFVKYEDVWKGMENHTINYFSKNRECFIEFCCPHAHEFMIANCFFHYFSLCHSNCSSRVWKIPSKTTKLYLLKIYDTAFDLSISAKQADPGGRLNEAWLVISVSFSLNSVHLSYIFH